MTTSRLRLLATLIACALLAGPVVALAGASSGRAELQLRQTALGKILVNSRGYTVYAFTKDTRNHNNCQQSRPCRTVWPAVTTVGAPIAGRGVKASLLGTITIRGGARQVTYAGHPLYTYLGDAHPGQTSYVNIYQSGGRWPALNASGQEVK